MAEAIETCVHCGFCLPACPTYQELGQETDSPRGRILLMKQVLEEELEPENISSHIDQCLGCLACETACPSGVKYRDLISPYRSSHAAARSGSFWERIRDRIVSATLPYPGRFRWALLLGRLTRFLSFLVPGPLRPMTGLVPDSIPPRVKLAQQYPVDQPTARVALLAGCAQQVLAPEINRQTIRLLNHCGATVVVGKNQSCCGALSWHNGHVDQARKLAAKNFDLFQDPQLDWIVTNAAGCGSGMQEYDVIFSGTDQIAEAAEIAQKTLDISVLLVRLGLADRLNQQTGDPPKIRVAYQDACHLSNGQNVREAPRSLLKAIREVELCELPGGETCCGSAGTYNIEQPDIAGQLGQKKAEAVIATGAEVLVTGNIGCLVQLQNHLKTLGSKIRVMHLVEFLASRIR